MLVLVVEDDGNYSAGADVLKCCFSAPLSGFPTLKSHNPGNSVRIKGGSKYLRQPVKLFAGPVLDLVVEDDGIYSVVVT